MDKLQKKDYNDEILKLLVDRMQLGKKEIVDMVYVYMMILTIEQKKIVGKKWALEEV